MLVNDMFDKNAINTAIVSSDYVPSDILEPLLPPPEPPDEHITNQTAYKNDISPLLVLNLLASYDATLKPLTSIDKVHLRVLCDEGANRSVTNDESILHTSCDIEPYSMGGIGGCNALVCTKKGIYHMVCDDHSTLPIEIFYCTTATEKVISPTDIVFSNQEKYDSWWQLANYKSGTGHLRFYTSTGLDSCEVKLYLKNKLWYLTHDPANTLYCKAILKANDAFVAS